MADMMPRNFMEQLYDPQRTSGPPTRKPLVTIRPPAMEGPAAYRVGAKARQAFAALARAGQDAEAQYQAEQAARGQPLWFQGLQGTPFAEAKPFNFNPVDVVAPEAMRDALAAAVEEPKKAPPKAPPAKNLGPRRANADPTPQQMEANAQQQAYMNLVRQAFVGMPFENFATLSRQWEAPPVVSVQDQLMTQILGELEADYTASLEQATTPEQISAINNQRLSDYITILNSGAGKVMRDSAMMGYTGG